MHTRKVIWKAVFFSIFLFIMLNLIRISKSKVEVFFKISKCKSYQFIEFVVIFDIFLIYQASQEDLIFGTIFKFIE